MLKCFNDILKYAYNVIWFFIQGIFKLQKYIGMDMELKYVKNISRVMEK